MSTQGHGKAALPDAISNWKKLGMFLDVSWSHDVTCKPSFQSFQKDLITKTQMSEKKVSSYQFIPELRSSPNIPRKSSRRVRPTQGVQAGFRRFAGKSAKLGLEEADLQFQRKVTPNLQPWHHTEDMYFNIYIFMYIYICICIYVHV